MFNRKLSTVALILLATFAMIVTAGEPTPLDLTGKKVQRLEVSASLIGYTSTKVFYTLGDDRVVVAVQVENSKKGFPVTGTVYQFAKDVTLEDMGKWLNNQHSDALFPDVPEPKVMVRLPAESCRTLESKLLGQKRANETTYDEYRVEVKLAEAKVNEQFRLKEFKDTVKVYVVAK
ncbi:MAG: hypothetical protein ACK50P_19025 [Planctomycetaceae bacterium]|jgi:hypothetical protein